MDVQIYNPADLQTLPDVLKQNQLSKSNAANAVTKFLSGLPTDLTTVDLSLMESNDVLLNDFQAKLSVTIETMEGRRKPLTAKLDAIKKFFTTEENEVNALLDQVKDIRNNWNKEKMRRSALAQQKAEIEIERMKEFVEINAQIKRTIYERFLNAGSDLQGELYRQLNEATLDFLPVLELNFSKYEPVLTDERYFTLFDALPAPVSKHYTNAEVIALVQVMRDEMKADLQNEWVTKLTEVRDRILELIPSRARNIAVEVKLDVVDVKKELEAIDNQAEVDKINATFDAAAKATPVVGLTKGTVVKKKYAATTHKAFVAIVQYWVTNKMNKLTIEELSKKLSFMVTAANEDIDKITLEADGLTIEEDYTTRSTRRKTA